MYDSYDGESPGCYHFVCATGVDGSDEDYS